MVVVAVQGAPESRFIRNRLLPEGRSPISNIADTEDALALSCEPQVRPPQSAAGVIVGLLEATHVLNTQHIVKGRGAP